MTKRRSKETSLLTTALAVVGVLTIGYFVAQGVFVLFLIYVLRVPGGW